jgi:hypothetical protein
MTVKITNSLENDRDGELLPEILSLLLDQICWSVKMSYGDEIHRRREQGTGNRQQFPVPAFGDQKPRPKGRLCWAGLESPYNTYSVPYSLFPVNYRLVIKSLLPVEKVTMIIRVLGLWGREDHLTVQGRSIASSEAAIEEIEKRITVLEGMPVTVIDIQYPEAILILPFEGEYFFTITPDRNEESELADWEILTPERTILQSVRSRKTGVDLPFSGGDRRLD